MEIDIRSLVTLDFETYWDKDFTLSKMPGSVYVRDERFKVHCVGIKRGVQPTEVFFYDDVAPAIQAIDWSSAYLLGHNTAFDGFILSNCYGVVPAYYLDTLSLARGLLGLGVRHNLEHLSVKFGLLPKLSATLETTKGVAHYDAAMIETVREYCARDVDNTFYLFLKFMQKNFPTAELDLIDLTLRMYCQPILNVDRALVQEELEEQIGTKVHMLLRSGVTREELISNDKFAALLDRMGVEPPTKISKRTGKETWAFAKNDPDFMALMGEGYDEDIRQLVEARLILKSSIGETRAQRLLDVSANDRPVPVLLKYCGAHTTRWSAGDRMNFQNFPRGGRLRKALRAPPGHVLVVCDSAQIEARVNAWLAGQVDVLEKFRAGEDVYKYMASQIFGVPVDQIDKTQRFLGKVCVLALGYGMGAEKFQRTLKTFKPPIHLSPAEAADITYSYRRACQKITEQWKDLERAATHMTRFGALPLQYKCLRFEYEKIYLPNGLAMVYDDIEYDDEGQLRYWTLDGPVKLYGGIITENIVQGLARVVVAEQMARIAERYRIVLMTHDEVVACAPATEGEDAMNFMLEVMRTPPIWAPDLPVNAEGEFDERYVK